MNKKSAVKTATSEQDLTHLAKRVKEARGKLTPAAFSRLIGVTRSALSQIESGSIKYLKAETAFKMQDASGFSARWLALGQGQKRVIRKTEDMIPTEVIELAIKLYDSANTQQRPMLSDILKKASEKEKVHS